MRTVTSSHFGQILRYWRKRRGLTQFELAADANISTRHISFIESGRSQPSPDTAIRLVDLLELPPLRRNELLNFAGLGEKTTPLEATGTPTKEISSSLHALMDCFDPFPAFAMDAYKNVIQGNNSFNHFFDGSSFPVTRFNNRTNLPLTMANNEGLTDCLENWETLFLQMVLSIEYSALEHPEDNKLTQLHQCLQNHRKTQHILKNCMQKPLMDGEVCRLSVRLNTYLLDFTVASTSIWDNSGHPVKYDILSVVPIGEESMAIANSLMKMYLERPQ